MPDDRIIKCIFERKKWPSRNFSNVIEEKESVRNDQLFQEKLKTYAIASVPSHNLKNINRRHITFPGNKRHRQYELIKSKNKLYLIVQSTHSQKNTMRIQKSTPEIDSQNNTTMIESLKKTQSLLNSQQQYISAHKQRQIVKQGLYSFRPFTQTNIYRCQARQKQVCCCNCNSDAMFEVMKSLYDCYKNKDCNECNCVLCGPVPGRKRVEKGVGEEGIEEVGIHGLPSEVLRRAREGSLLDRLKGKKSSEKEEILRGLAKIGVPLPEGRTESERKLMQKVRKDLGLPPAPVGVLDKGLMARAYAKGLITPLAGKTKSEKEVVLRKLAKLGIALPEGQTASEKSLIARVQKTTRASQISPPSEKLRKAKAEGLLTPIEGKTLEEKERILRGLAKAGIPLPKGKTASEKKIISKVRQDLGLPAEPRTSSEKERLAKAYAAGLITPLEGKSKSEKEKILRRMVEMKIPLPKGRTASEKAMIDKIKPQILAEKLKKARAEGLLTPLQGKTAAEKERILRRLAQAGIPLPEGKTSSEKKLIQKIRKTMGLPSEPKTPSEKVRISRAYAAGIVTPLEGKTNAQKEKVLRKLAAAGVPLPEGRTPSEKALIAKVKAATKRVSSLPKMTSEKIQKLREAGLLTPLEGKTETEKRRILKGLAEAGIPLPRGKTSSERRLIDKIRLELGLPPEPKTSSQRMEMAKLYAAGDIVPLEGKTTAQKEKILKRLAKAGIPLPEGRTASEKKLIKAIKETVSYDMPTKTLSERIRGAKDKGLLSSLSGKTSEEKERILRGLADAGLPLPPGKTASERRLIDKIRFEKGLPPEPKTSSQRIKMAKLYATGGVVPLEGKTAAQKEKILKGLLKAGVTLPEGRTASERKFIKKIKETTPYLPPSKTLSERIRGAKEEGLLSPLAGKTSAEKERILKGLADAGLPLPPAKTASERRLIDKIRFEKGLPPEPKTSSQRIKMERLYAAGGVVPLDGKTTAQKERILKGLFKAGVPLPEGRTASERKLIKRIKETTPLVTLSKTLSERIKEAKDEGLLSPLAGKTSAEKERILKGLADAGLPLPQGKTSTERRLIDKIRFEKGLPPEPKTSSQRIKMAKMYATGGIVPLDGKTTAEKEKILKGFIRAGVPLPEGRTDSERKLIKRMKETTRYVKPTKTLSERIKEAKDEGFITPLAGKTGAEKERIIKGLAQRGIPLPEGQTSSEKKLVAKIRKDLGLPVPKTTSEKARLEKYYAAGLVTPLEGKSKEEKEKILRRMAEFGIPLPEGRTESEKSLIEKIKLTAPKKLSLTRIPPDKLRKIQEAGLLTSFERKTPEQKEQILRGLAEAGVPLPEGKTSSEKLMIRQIRKDLGLPPEPKTQSERKRLAKAYAAGIITPLEGKTTPEKELALRRMAAAGISLPEGRTKSERALIEKVKATTEPVLSITKIPTEKLREMKKAGLLTPLEDKSPEEKERIFRKMVKAGAPLPKAKTSADKKIIQKVLKDMGLPPEPRTQSQKDKLAKAYKAGLITPLEGKTAKEKEKILRKLAAAGIELPEGRTVSEQALIEKVKATTEPAISITKIPTEKLREMKKAGLLTPLEGKSPEERERIFRKMAEAGVPLPQAKTSEDKRIMQKVIKDMGLPPAPKTQSQKEKLAKAYKAGLITPLEGKTAKEKERVLRRMAAAGLELPEGRTASEQALIDEVKATTKPAVSITKIPTDKLRELQKAGLLTPLYDKTPEEKERILKKMVLAGVPLPEAKTSEDKRIMQKVIRDMGLPPEARTREEQKRIDKAYAAGLITPLEGKTTAEKERALRRMAAAGIALPVGRTKSERALIEKVKATTKPALSITKISTEKLREMKKAGLLTPLEGKSPEEKERIFRRMAKAGVPLPEAKTSEDKRIIQKVIKGMGLPPEPKTQAQKEKLAKAYKAGLITPLEGKTAKEKERVLRRMAAAGLELPEGRTASEQALIDEVKATTKPAVSITKIPTDKLRELQEAGLLTPLHGKTPEEKERILKKLVLAGVPLPEAKTSEDKRIMQKVIRDMGLPPEARTREEQKRIDKAYAAGLITPLEGKTTAEKERALRRMAAAGIALPVGRTKSERALIEKVKATTEPAISITKIPTEKLREMKEGGLLTPLEGKSPEERERIFRKMAKAGVPLPQAKTSEDKRIMQKVIKDMGLPPAPKTQSQKEKLAKAYKAGLITPLEGKTAKEKERVLRKMAAAGLELPEGRTASEQALIDEVKATTKPAVSITKIPTEKLREMKEAGLLTPLEGKSPEEKERIFRKMAKAGVPLPEAKTLEDKRIMQKVIKDIGLPPEPKTQSQKERFAKAYKAGLITPLEGKTAQEKERILKKMAAAGLELPEGRTASEQDLIDAVKMTTEKTFSLTRIPSEQLRKMRDAAVLTPFETKTEKEKVLRGIAKAGVALPEGKTSSERKLIRKVRRDLGLPTEPKTKSEKEKLDKAYAAGLITPLEGKTMAEKERALRRMAAAGIPLPSGRTTSERALIEKVKATTEPALSITNIPTEKLREMKEAGLLTPLEGKSPEEKERIFKRLAEAGLPLPKAKTSEDKKIIQKVIKDMGLPPEPKSQSEKDALAKAYQAGLITPLEGKTKEEKKLALRRMAQLGIPLPEGRTASEKSLIRKIQKLSATKLPSDKIRKAKAEGLFTPLEGKTPQEKEVILKKLAAIGLPLPEGKTSSENKLIQKVRKEMGLPPEPKTLSEKLKMAKAYAAGMVTPLEGKTRSQKEKALRRMAAMDIPLPEGRTPSEKALIDKINKEYADQKKKTKRKRVVARGISEEIIEVKKTTKCEKACGCDRKKIRFKHSYIKIRVTSPDISSFCSCPDECIPGVKGGVFVDNEGIKVTVGRVTTASSYTPSSGSAISQNRISSSMDTSSISLVCKTMRETKLHLEKSPKSGLRNVDDHGFKISPIKQKSVHDNQYDLEKQDKYRDANPKNHNKSMIFSKYHTSSKIITEFLRPRSDISESTSDVSLSFLAPSHSSRRNSLSSNFAIMSVISFDKNDVTNSVPLNESQIEFVKHGMFVSEEVKDLLSAMYDVSSKTNLREKYNFEEDSISSCSLISGGHSKNICISKSDHVNDKVVQKLSKDGNVDLSSESKTENSTNDNMKNNEIINNEYITTSSEMSSSIDIITKLMDKISKSYGVDNSVSPTKQDWHPEYYSKLSNEKQSNEIPTIKKPRHKGNTETSLQYKISKHDAESDQTQFYKERLANKNCKTRDISPLILRPNASNAIQDIETKMNMPKKVTRSRAFTTILPQIDIEVESMKLKKLILYDAIETGRRNQLNAIGMQSNDDGISESEMYSTYNILTRPRRRKKHSPKCKRSDSGSISEVDDPSFYQCIIDSDTEDELLYNRYNGSPIKTNIGKLQEIIDLMKREPEENQRKRRESTPTRQYHTTFPFSQKYQRTPKYHADASSSLRLPTVNNCYSTEDIRKTQKHGNRTMEHEIQCTGLLTPLLLHHDQNFKCTKEMATQHRHLLQAPIRTIAPFNKHLQGCSECVKAAEENRRKHDSPKKYVDENRRKEKLDTHTRTCTKKYSPADNNTPGYNYCQDEQNDSETDYASPTCQPIHAQPPQYTENHHKDVNCQCCCKCPKSKPPDLQKAEPSLLSGNCLSDSFTQIFENVSESVEEVLSSSDLIKQSVSMKKFCNISSGIKVRIKPKLKTKVDPDIDRISTKVDSDIEHISSEEALAYYDLITKLLEESSPEPRSSETELKIEIDSCCSSISLEQKIVTCKCSLSKKKSNVICECSKSKKKCNSKIHPFVFYNDMKPHSRKHAKEVTHYTHRVGSPDHRKHAEINNQSNFTNSSTSSVYIAYE